MQFLNFSPSTPNAIPFLPIRWVRFQEDVEDGGKRWSKPFVPALKLSALMDLRNFLEAGMVALNVEGRTVNEILGEKEGEGRGQG